jgi:DNA processing protein
MQTPVRRVRLEEAEFPPGLRHLDPAPGALYVQGRLRPEDQLAVAIVGARRATPYGLQVAARLARDLAGRGVTIVSGLARGIDGSAHRAALEAGGRTVAVLGSGIDVIYPPEHGPLARAIAAAGAVLTELPPGAAPLPWHFPMRNRLIAALALGVVVVEAAERSGALTTASWAADLGREVMAVPGRVTSELSRGTHRLIRDGATLVESADDVVAQLPARWAERLRPAPVPAAPAGGAGDPAADVLLAALGDDAVAIDELVARSGLPMARAAAVLLELELAGRVRQLAGLRYARGPA